MDLLTLNREIIAATDNSRRVQVIGASDSLSQLIVLGLISYLNSGYVKNEHRNIIVILPSTRDFTLWQEIIVKELELYENNDSLSKTIFLPYFSGWGKECYANFSLGEFQRLLCFSSLLRKNNVNIVITTLQALAQSTVLPSLFFENSFNLDIDQEIDQDKLVTRLESLNYQRVETVDEKGTYAIRGRILDVFTPSESTPVRLEFLVDTICSMRLFSQYDQRSIADITRVLICPPVEAILLRENRKKDVQKLYEHLLDLDVNKHDREGIVDVFSRGLFFPNFHLFLPLFRNDHGTGFDYLNHRDIIVFPKSIKSCVDNYREFLDKQKQEYEKDIALGRATLSVLRHYISPDSLNKILKSRRVLEIGGAIVKKDTHAIYYKEEVFKETTKFSFQKGSQLFDSWIELIRDTLKNRKAAIVILTNNCDDRRRIESIMTHRGFEPQIIEGIFAEIFAARYDIGRLYIGIGVLKSHVWLYNNHLLIIPESALVGVQKHKPIPQCAKLKNYLSSFRNLKVGSLVVHLQHGIGRYLGLKNLNIGAMNTDFLILEYAGKDRVYLPVDRLHLLQKYNAGIDSKLSPPLDKLKGQSWVKRKSKVQKAVKELAGFLLDLQAKRKLTERSPYSAPGDLYYQFEAEFEFEETEDQKSAILDINHDLSRKIPMDRLVCGDVGFGKTEVALRAAMRVVLDGFQIVVLAPTTILCYQHYRTFKIRFENFGISVAQVNRFIKGKEIKQTITAFNSGRIDILVGTHRILSKDIVPRRLGLIIIDEEQRFGVEHKETLKTLSGGLDILTLTATPIPRTLHMSMLGLKDISVITTAPRERISCRTYVAGFEEELIKIAIEHEVQRGGQVYFIHNNIESIDYIAAFLKDLLGNIKVRVAHGRLTSTRLEEIMIDFIDQKFSVLLCTTIIESGIDIPNVNTLIVNDADRFGLSQLYQMRGRVGRASRQSYAYFLVSKNKSINEEANRRLEILQTHQDLGAGFQIASYDLEMRGTGNLLGRDQSGQIKEVGFELYTKLLESTIRKIQGKRIPELKDIEIKIPISAGIPKEYVKEENSRLYIYKNIFSAASEMELEEIKKDLKDRYGPLPGICVNIFRVAKLKQLLNTINAASISKMTMGIFEIRFFGMSEKQIKWLIELSESSNQKYNLTQDYRLIINIGSKEKGDETGTKMLEELIDSIYVISHSFERSEASD